jgi:hypothetical protein
LQEYQRSRAAGSFSRKSIPRRSPRPEDEAVAQGLTGAPTQKATTVYFGLVGTNTLAGHEVIPFFDQGREEYLEYDLTSMIYKLSQPQKPEAGRHFGAAFGGRARAVCKRRWPAIPIPTSSISSCATITTCRCSIR